MAEVKVTTIGKQAKSAGPESLFSERVDIQGWAASYGYGYQQRPDFALIDSGFGPLMRGTKW